MPHLAFDMGFCAQLGKLQGTFKQGAFDAREKFDAGQPARILIGPAEPRS
ncbi:hypothetical protein [Streptomyces sp. NPDC000880]